MREQSNKNPTRRVRKYDFINPLVGHRLRILRDEKEVSRSQAAKIIDITLKQLDAIESGREDLTAENIYKLCAYFNIDAGYFFIDCAEICRSNGKLQINAHQAKEVWQLLDSYLNLPNREMQKSLVRLAESIANSEM